jgi:hypothetical protein
MSHGQRLTWIGILLLVIFAVVVIYTREPPYAQRQPDEPTAPATARQEAAPAPAQPPKIAQEAPPSDDKKDKYPAPPKVSARPAKPELPGTTGVSWQPHAECNITPETEAKIREVIENAVAKLGLDKVSTASIQRVITVIRPGTANLSFVACESFMSPDWMRTETLLDPSLHNLAKDSITIVTNGKLLQFDRGQAADQVAYEDPAWYNLTNHPLMMHHELNPHIYESVETKVLDKDAAQSIGAPDAAGHRIAVLRTPRAGREGKMRFETWIDEDTGRIVNYLNYSGDAVLMQRCNFEYQEIEKGIFFPMKTTQRVPSQQSSIVYQVETIAVNKGVSREHPLTFTDGK